MRHYPAGALRAHGIFFLAATILLLAGCQTYYSSHSSGVYHTVLKGQSIYSISKAYGMRPDTLAGVNGIKNPDHLHAGRQLWIPNAIRVIQVPVTSGARVKPTRRSHIKKTFPQVARKPGKLSPRQAQKKSRISQAPAKSGFIWPVKGGVLTSRYGNRNGRKHEGIDIGAKAGTPIRSASAGTVMFSGPGPTGYGLMVIIKHSGNLMTVYSHNSKNYARKNMRVKQGQIVAAVGSTGRSTGPHLHFEVRNDTQPMDPLRYLPKI